MAALARLFAWLDRVLGGGGAASRSGLVSRPRPPARPRSPLANAALLSVDGGGQFLLCGGERLTLGHLRAGQADLGFLADVGARHAVLERAESLLEGPGWRIVPCAGEAVQVGGRPLGPEGCRLASGDRVRLGENLEFLVELPDPASASAVLELLHGVECSGARRVVLFAPGAGGRVRIGSTLGHVVRVPGLDFELVLEWSGEELALSSELPLRREGLRAEDGAQECRELRLAFPPRAHEAFTSGRPLGSRPPFGFSLEPVSFP